MSLGRRIWIALTAVLCVAAGPVPARAEPVSVFAAASLSGALDEVAAAWQAQTGKAAVASYAASSALARQIEEGAPADVFISADEAWMDRLAEKGLIRGDSRSDLLGNTLVLVAPADSAIAVEPAPGFGLEAALAGGRLAVAEVTSVPAGKYAKAALESLKVWDGVKDQLAEAENVRAALALVARGESPLAIVYRTDAAADPGVRTVGAFPAGSHPPITYPVALVAGRDNPDAAGFLDFVRGPAARAVFEKHGFTVLPAAASK